MRSPDVITSTLPGKEGSCWIATAPETFYPKLTSSLVVDVAVVGAGIVGLTAAYLLSRAGLSVAVLEARRIGRQVTGGSTAKITTQHSLIYRYLIETLGLETAQRYADANQLGMDQIRRWVEQLGIACAFETKDAYVYCSQPSRLGELEAEAEASRKVGLDADVVDRAPLPLSIAGALRCRNQAQFNPTQYLLGLAKASESVGALICEETRVTSVEERDGWHLKAGRVSIRAKNVVLATNLPIGGPIPYDERTRPRSHIAMAFRIDDEAVINGMFIGIDEPTHSLRTGYDQDGLLLVVLGAKFGTGLEGDIAKYFRTLETWARRNLDVGPVAWHWVNEDYDTPDRIPFVGATSRAPGLYVATGFNAWGISNGTAAGILIAETIVGTSPPWAPVFDPLREVPKNFNKGGDSQSLIHSLDEIEPGGGGVIKLGRDKIAIHKADDGTFHAVSAACTHKGCIVTWNNAARTWDCPCHGSIFSADGSVIHGPAVKPLPAKTLPPNWSRRAARSLGGSRLPKT